METIKEKFEYKTLAEFLESCPPMQLSHISDLSVAETAPFEGRLYNKFNPPELQLHCSNSKCNGVRFFRFISKTGRPNLGTDDYTFAYVGYECSNCQDEQKIFSLAAKIKVGGKPEGVCFKFGESPAYGPPVSPKLISLIGSDREAFLKGRRCENQGLGVGSFSYYRRVVENQKNRILEEIIRVSEKIRAPADKIEVLKSAVRETQFRKALEMAKDALPESLLIDGHSPLQLLHSALSEGLHALTDDQCLAIAGSIRVVLGELSERLSQALKDEGELVKALSVLMNRKKTP